MPNPPEGWYFDPDGSEALRWWTGEEWSSSVSPPLQPPAPAPVHPGRGGRIALGATAGVLGVIGLATSGAGGALIMVGLVGMTAAFVALVRGKAPSIRIRSRRVALGALAASFAVVTLGSIVSPHPDPALVEASQIDGSVPTQNSDQPTAEPAPTPVVTTQEDTTTATIPFSATTVDDPTLATGTTVVTVNGVNGVLTVTWRVTYSDGKEVKRVKVSEDVTTPPVDQVTAIGSYVAPPPPPPAAPSCDPNYSGQCVPIASDVDCAGGSGNGPAYTAGPVTVVGYDTYDLDRDGDGIACD